MVDHDGSLEGRQRLEPGTLFADRYEIQAHSVGAIFDSVCIAIDRTTRRRVAVVLFEVREDWGPRETERFRIEATAAAARIENEVPVIDAGYDPNTQSAFAVVQFLEGAPGPIEGSGPPQFTELIEHLRQIASEFDWAVKPGTLIASRYVIQNRRLGIGGSASVYAAIDRITKRRVAVKVFEKCRDWSVIDTEQFKFEATVAGLLKSEHIVQVLDAGYDRNIHYPFIVMEELEGQNLQELVEQSGALQQADVVEYLRQVASALDKAHAWTDQAGRPSPMLHLDLKPANLFLIWREDNTPLIKILDWGLGKVQLPTATISCGPKGTPLYIAPETLDNKKRTPATDTWALGLVAFFLLTGRCYWMSAPLDDGGLYALYKEILDGPNEPASERVRRLGSSIELPLAFNEWFAQAANLDPAQRFQRAGDAVMALAIALGIPIRALRSSSPNFTRSDSSTPRVNPTPLSPDGTLLKPAPAPDGLPTVTASPPAPPLWSRRRMVRVSMMVAVLLVAVLIAKRARVERTNTPDNPSDRSAEPTRRTTAQEKPTVDASPTSQPSSPSPISPPASRKAAPNKRADSVTPDRNSPVTLDTTGPEPAKSASRLSSLPPSNPGAPVAENRASPGSDRTTATSPEQANASDKSTLAKMRGIPVQVRD